MRGTVKVVARKMENGGTSIRYDGHQVAFGLNAVEAFIVLGGILSRKGSKIVSMEMERPDNPKLVEHFDLIKLSELFNRSTKKMFGRRPASRKTTSHKSARKTASRRLKRG